MSTLLQFIVACLLSLFGSSNGITSQHQVFTYFFNKQPIYPRDCKVARDLCITQSSSGVVLIKPDGYHEPFEVYCENDVESGGWTIIQRRHDGFVTFQRNWMEYKLGFGFLIQDFWIGNEKLSYLTNQDTYELRIDFYFSNGSSFYASYNSFRVSDEQGGYELTSVGIYNGTASFPVCQANKEYRSCACETSCATPLVCSTTCAGGETCICPEGFFINGNSCVLPHECGCFIGGNVIAESEVYISPDCSQNCSCTDGQLICDEAEGGESFCDIPIDCLEVYERGNHENGLYDIKPRTWSGAPFQVYCNMTDGGGWTVFQRRVDGSVYFHLFWDDYKNGFGSQDHEFWLGNEKIYSLTNQRQYTLRIDFVNVYGDPYYAKYDLFLINDETDNYRLTVGNYSEGDAGHSLTSRHNNQQFSTRDRDNDIRNIHLAGFFDRGGWWFEYYVHCDLNGDYNEGQIQWYNLPGGALNIKYTEMKIRPVST